MNESPTNRLVTIYALCDPDTNEVRYIGQTARPDTRLYQHVATPHGPQDNSRHKWIDALVATGKTPNLVVLEVVDQSQASIAEQKWIAHGTSNGWKLTNRKPGRPRVNNAEKTQPYPISLTPTEAETIREIGGGNLTEGVRKMLGINETRRSEVVINDHTYTLVRDWLDQYDLYDDGKHLGTFHFSPGGKTKPDQSTAFKNPYGVNMFYVSYAGFKHIGEHESTVQAACERIVKETEATSIQ